MLVTVKTRDAHTGEYSHDMGFNYADHQARVKLSKHIMWAVNNDKCVEIYPKGKTDANVR